MKNIKVNSSFKYIVASILWLSTSVSHAVSTQLVAPLTTEVGQTFTIDVFVNGVFNGKDPLDEVIAFGFDVTNSNTGIAALLSTSVATPFNDDSALFPDTEVAGSAFPGIANEPVNNNIQLATLTFQALSLGTVSLGIASNLSDVNEGLLYFLDPISADITASTSVNIVPVPAAIWLFGAGLLGLIGIARKKVV